MSRLPLKQYLVILCWEPMTMVRDLSMSTASLLSVALVTLDWRFLHHRSNSFDEADIIVSSANRLLWDTHKEKSLIKIKIGMYLVLNPGELLC